MEKCSCPSKQVPPAMKLREYGYWMLMAQITSNIPESKTHGVNKGIS